MRTKNNESKKVKHYDKPFHYVFTCATLNIHHTYIEKYTHFNKLN